MPPKVSILLPNLNHRPYLEERMQTIMAQTFTDWELIVVDGYSDDGAWEYFQDWAKKDPRIKISRAPRQGIYAGWNQCIRTAKGEYVYIAASDDTMSPEFLEIMVKALDRYPQCDLAHCKLTVIDEKGRSHPVHSWDRFYCAEYFGKRIHREHIRFAPHDGLLHCGVRTVYTSITQLLIRRSLFQRIGLFLNDWGSVSDFEWDMRASLTANTIHIPRYLATWRVHRRQASDLDSLQTAKHMTQLLAMIDQAFKIARNIRPDLLNKIDTKEIKYLYTKEMLQFEFREQMDGDARAMIDLKWRRTYPELLTAFYHAENDPARPFFSPWEPITFCRKILAKYGFENNLKDTDRGLYEK